MKNWGSKVRYWISSVFKVKLNFKVKVLCWTFYAAENMFGDSWTKLDCCSVNSSFYDHIYRSAVKLAADVFFNRFITKAPSNATWGVGGGALCLSVCSCVRPPAFKSQRWLWCECVNCFVLCPGMYHTLLTYVRLPAPLPSHTHTLRRTNVQSIPAESWQRCLDGHRGACQSGVVRPTQTPGELCRWEVGESSMDFVFVLQQLHTL